MIALAVVVGVGASCGGGTDVITPTALRFVTQPASVGAGQAFGVSVEFIGAEDKRATQVHDPVTIAVLGGATISGPATVAAASGVATFTGLSMTAAGASIQLQATTASGLSTTSAAFAVAPGAPDAAHSSISPASGTIAPNVATAFTFTFKDAYANPLPSLDVTVASNLAGATFTPSAGTTNGSGAFATSFKATAIGSATISATVGGTVINFSTPYVVAELCPPAPLTIPGSVTGTLPSGACVITGQPAAAFRFNVASQTEATFSVTAGFTPTFEVTSDPPAQNVAVNGQPNTASSFNWMLPQGTFLFRLRAQSGTGAFTATSAVATVVPGCTLDNTAPGRALAVAGTYTGQDLAATDCDFGDGSFFDVFFIQSSQPCTLTLKSTVITPWLAVVNLAVDTFLAFDGGHGVGVDATVSLPACNNAGQPIQIWPNSEPNELGAYTLVVTFTGTGAVRADDYTGVHALRATPSAGPATMPALVRMMQLKSALRKSR